MQQLIVYVAQICCTKKMSLLLYEFSCSLFDNIQLEKKYSEASDDMVSSSTGWQEQ